MKKKQKKIYLQQKKRYLKKIVGTLGKPRLAVFRSHKHIYAQLIDDTLGQTITSSSTLEKKEEFQKKSKATREISFFVGEFIAQKAKDKKITEIIFDRGEKPYHGRIQSLAEGARKGGLIF